MKSMHQFEEQEFAEEEMISRLEADLSDAAKLEKAVAVLREIKEQERFFYWPEYSQSTIADGIFKSVSSVLREIDA